MRTPKVIDQFLRRVEVLVAVVLAGAAFLFFALACIPPVNRPAGISAAPSFLLQRSLSCLLAAVVVALSWRRRAARGSGPDVRALPDPGPRWSDRPGAWPPGAIRPDQARVSESPRPDPGVERGEAP
jgi:hypothetical protein